EYPVPVLLILTGQPKYIQSYSGLAERINTKLFRGYIEQKGLDPREHFRVGLAAAQQYADFGLRISDRLDRAWPTITSREEDLLRRFGLENATNAGLDLEWWSAERKIDDSGAQVWSKVLVGHFWLKDHDMESRPFFFKLESRSHGQASYKASKVLEGALQHIQLPGQVLSQDRSLMVTAQATLSGNPPLSLSEFLRRPSSEVELMLFDIANDVADQLDRLGTSSTEPKADRDLVWRFHEQQLAAYDEQHRQFTAEEDTLPSKVLAHVKLVAGTPWIPWRSCQHGDLHLGNVSIDIHGSRAFGFLIDAGAMEPGPAGKDLAAFEVALVLHQASSSDTVLTAVVGMFGAAQWSEASSNIESNTTTLLKQIRERAMKITDAKTYQLLLLDQAMIQFGSLVYGSFGNKIAQPKDAFELYRAIARAYLRM
ncbi:MAG TPA: hypothetical protein VG944_19380, partial [Fimbriimonas sp.]|nr:hypothetical protein [Fimbriimonas sp.]